MKRLLFAMVLLVSPMGAAIADDGTDAYIGLLRSDLRADKEKVVEYTMDLEQKDADTFWKIYNEYEVERSKLGDRTVDLIKRFPDAFNMTGPDTIGALSAEWLKLQQDEVKLISKYYKKAEKALSPRIAARWMQIEHRLGLLIDVQISSQVPLIDRVPR